MNHKIYTLAQNRTSSFEFVLDKTIISGTGTPTKDYPAIIKRVKKKVIANAVVLAMNDNVSKNGDMDMVQAYWNTYHW